MSHSLSTEITCLSYFVAKPQHRDELITALHNLVASTRAEPGCLQYELVIDNADPNFLIMVEKFVDQKALDDHEQQPYIKQFVENDMDCFCEKVTWNVGREIII